MNAELEKILEGYRDEMVEKLQEFIRIESVAVSKGAECTQETPFGKGSAAALEFMMELGREKGFATRNYDNMVCELDFGERKDEAVGTIGHAGRRAGSRSLGVSAFWRRDPRRQDIRTRSHG